MLKDKYTTATPETCFLNYIWNLKLFSFKTLLIQDIKQYLKCTSMQEIILIFVANLTHLC